MQEKKKIIIVLSVLVLSVLALLGIAGWQHWEYHYNTPVAIVCIDEEFSLESISSIIGTEASAAEGGRWGYVWDIIFESGHERKFGSYGAVKVVNRQYQTMDITPQEALLLSQQTKLERVGERTNKK